MKSITLSSKKVNFILVSYKEAKNTVWNSELMKNIYEGKAMAFEYVLHTMGFSDEDLRNYLENEAI